MPRHMMAAELRQIRERDEAGGEKLNMLGVAWQNLTSEPESVVA